jgi:hypothetical protein
MDSIMIAVADPRVATTITGASTFGNTWEKMILIFPIPEALAAMIKSFCLTESTELLTIRA